MANKTENKAPTSDEVKAAQAILNRHAAAVEDARRARLAPVGDLARSKEAQAIIAMIDEMPEDTLSDINVSVYLNQIRASLQSLSGMAPAAAPPLA